MPKAAPPQDSLDALRRQRKSAQSQLSLPERLAQVTREAAAEQRADGTSESTVERIAEKTPETAAERLAEVSGKTGGASAASPIYRQTKVVQPDLKTMRANRIIAPFSDTREADIFRMLRTQVLKRMGQRNARTLGICSAREGEGKSLVALNLAISLSQVDNRTVLLAELDLRRPSLLKTLGLTVEKGLDDVLDGDAEIADCLINPGYDRLVILPARNRQWPSSDVVLSTKMGLLADELRDRYSDRLVIYDLPPLLLSDASIAFMRHLDACLLVVEEGRTAKNEIEHALTLIDNDLLIGTVLNKASRISNRHYGYY